MKVNQISLDQRLNRIKAGFPSDPAFVISSIKSLARIPITVYLNAFNDEEARLYEILGMEPYDEQNELTYLKVAIRIYEMRKLPEYKELANEAIYILSLPLRRCYEERKSVYEKRTEDTT